MPSPKPGMPGKPIGPKQPLIKGKPKLVVDPKPIKGKMKNGEKPYPMPSIDDDIVRMMPITSKQLGQIKKRYGI
jgi:hypothetical protein